METQQIASNFLTQNIESDIKVMVHLAIPNIAANKQHGELTITEITLSATEDSTVDSQQLGDPSKGFSS